MPNNVKLTPMPMLGVDLFHYALLESDTEEKPLSYREAKRVPGLTSVAFNPNAQSATFHADNGPYASAAQLGELTLTVGLADVPPEIRAIWFGQKYENGVLHGTQINPPDIAVGYRVKKADGGYRYFWFLKCKAAPPSETVNTQANSVSFQSGTITITSVIPVSSDDAWRSCDDNDPTLPDGVTPGKVAEGWFTSPLWKPEAVIE